MSLHNIIMHPTRFNETSNLRHRLRAGDDERWVVAKEAENETGKALAWFFEYISCPLFCSVKDLRPLSPRAQSDDSSLGIIMISCYGRQNILPTSMRLWPIPLIRNGIYLPMRRTSFGHFMQQDLKNSPEQVFHHQEGISHHSISSECRLKD